MITALNSRLALMSFQSPITYMYCLGLNHVTSKPGLLLLLLSMLIIVRLLLVVVVVIVVEVVVTDKFDCFIVWSTETDKTKLKVTDNLCSSCVS